MSVVQPGDRVGVAAQHALVAKESNAPCRTSGSTDDTPSLPGGHEVRRVEAERAPRRPTSRRAARRYGSVGLGRVLQEHQSVRVGDTADRIDSRRGGRRGGLRSPPRCAGRWATSTPQGRARTRLLDVGEDWRGARERTALAVAAKVNEGTMTSSPGPMPMASNPRCSALVPEFTATQGARRRAAENSGSNAATSSALTQRPLEDIVDRLHLVGR